MAIGATMRRFEIALADADRGTYADLDLRVAQHPSESERYLVARVLARALEHDEGVEFGRGVSTDDEPAIWRRDLRGDLLAWIEVGAPSVERLHRASKACQRVAVYGWKACEALAGEIAERRIHRAEAVEIHAFSPALIDVVAGELSRNHRWALSVSGGALYLDVGGGVVHEGTVHRLPIAS
jgi:uncharacterized protein YaeQ